MHINMDLAKISWKLIVVILAISAVMTVVAFKESEDHTIVWVLLAVMTILLVFLLIVLMYSRDIKARLEYDGLHVTGPMLSIRVPFGEIRSTEIRDGGGIMSYGIRIGGYGGIDRLGGRFRNSEFGNYKLGVRVSVKKCIVVRYMESKVLVFNLENEDRTEQFYNELRRMVGK